MNEFEIVKHIMMLDHITYDDLSTRLGYKSKSSSYITLNNKHIYVDTLRKFLSELGYELVVRKKGKTDGGYIIDDSDTPSPLRFHGMSMQFGTEPVRKSPYRSRAERLRLSEELKHQTRELTLTECENKLFDIWSTLKLGRNRKKEREISEYECEYLRYKKEIEEIYKERSV